MEYVNDKLISWLNKELEKRGWSQRELARRADLSQTTISAIIAGQRQPTLSNRRKRIIQAWEKEAMDLWTTAAGS